MAAKISISFTDATLVTWAQEKAEREGKTLSAIFSEMAEHQRRREAMERYLDWAGGPTALTPETRERVRAELEGAPRRVKRGRRGTRKSAR